MPFAVTLPLLPVRDQPLHCCFNIKNIEQPTVLLSFDQVIHARKW
jgi:hypothetical protein